MIHVIEIREMVPGGKPGTVKFKSTANLTYNCNKPELNGHWAVGEKYKIDFNISKFQGSRGEIEMKWVNKARFWKDGDGDVDPAEKPVYQGGGGGSYSGPKKSSSNEGWSMEKTKDIHRQVAAKIAGDVIGNIYQGGASALTAEVFDTLFLGFANRALSFIEAAPKSGDAGVADSGSEETPTGDIVDEFDGTF